MTFASDVEAAVVPTQDREEAREVIENLQLTSQTHLYDGVLAAVRSEVEALCRKFPLYPEA